MKDIPYSTLKEDTRAFDIMTLRDQYSNTFPDIAREYGLSPVRAKQIYNKIKLKQLHLYVRHISIALGHERVAEIRKEYYAAYMCYHTYPYVCAYLETKYKDLLEEYRAGAPGLPEQFTKRLPPLKRQLSEVELSRIVELREKQKASYAAIGKELDITPEKVKHTYNLFYQRKVLAHVRTLQEETDSYEEKEAIWNRYFGKYQSARKRWEMVQNETTAMAASGAAATGDFAPRQEEILCDQTIK